MPPHAYTLYIPYEEFNIRQRGIVKKCEEFIIEGSDDMDIWFVSSLHYLKLLDEDFEMNLLGFLNITNHKKYIKQIQEHFPFVMSLGNITYKNMIGKPFIFNIFSEETTRLFFGSLSDEKLIDNYNGMSQILLTASWLVKDNSVNIGASYLCNNKKQSFSMSRRYILFSCADGKYRDADYSKGELDEIEKHAKRLLEISSEGSKSDTIAPNNISNIEYNSLSRVQRIMNYILLARSQSLLPLKVTFYIDFLESLMPDEGGEIQHKVCEFVSKYIGGDLNKKKELFKLVKDAYSIRSKFSHGQAIPNKHSSNSALTLIAINLDIIVRNIIMKILYSDYDIFTQDESSFKEWYINLILSS